MPRFSHDQINKPLLPDGDNGFAALNSHTQPSLLTQGTLAGLENGRLEADGMVVTRPGLAWWNDPKLYSNAAADASVGSVFFYDTPQKEALLVWYELTSGPQCHLIPMDSAGAWASPTTWTQPAGATADGPLPAPVAAVRNWSEQVLYQEAPPHTQWAQLVDRAYLAGNFVCDGLATNAAGRDGVAPSVALTSGEYFLWSFWWNGAAWERRPVKTPARFQHLCTLRYRLYAAPGRGSDNREALYCSDVLDGTTWGVGNSAIVGEGDGDPIMGLAVYDDRLLTVVKERSVWIVDVSGSGMLSPTIVAADWVMQKMSSGGGCVAPRTVIGCDGDVYWLSRQGLMGLGRVRESGRSEAATDLGLPVRNLLDRIAWNNVEHAACATYHEGRLYLAVPVDGAAEANLMLVFHVARQTWEGTWTFLPEIESPYYDPPGPVTPTADVRIRALTTSWFAGQEKLHLAGWHVCHFVESQTSDLPESTTGGAAVPCMITTRAYAHGLPLDDKRGHNVEITFWNSECDAVDVEAIRDGLPAQAIAEDVRTHTQAQTPIQTPFLTVAQTALRRRWHLGSLGIYRDIQLRLTQTGTGRLRLRSAVITATARNPKTLS